ncbi:hypothetical protein D3C87_1300320 [compost metagenome]
MATVERPVTLTTVSKVSRSLFSCLGSTAEIARAADAPQMATAPPVNTPKSARTPNRRALSQPTTMVAVTANTAASTVSQPSEPICSSVIRAPNSETPMRNRAREANSIPGRQRLCSLRKWQAMPNNRAYSSVGPP